MGVNMSDSFEVCPKCHMQIAIAAIKIHNELNHPVVARQEKVKETGVKPRVKGNFHYHKGRCGRCSCENEGS